MRRDVGGQPREIVGRQLVVVVEQQDPRRRRGGDPGVALDADRFPRLDVADRQRSERREIRRRQLLVAGIYHQHLAPRVRRPAQPAQLREHTLAAVAVGMTTLTSNGTVTAAP
jgi:hypothetical protein